MKSQESIDEACKRMLDLGMGYNTIQEVLKIGSERISKIKKGQKLLHNIGRPKSLTIAMTNYIELLSLTNARYTDADVMKAVNEKFGTNIQVYNS